jgi:hypothetical protein
LARVSYRTIQVHDRGKNDSETLIRTYNNQYSVFAHVRDLWQASARLLCNTAGDDDTLKLVNKPVIQSDAKSSSACDDSKQSANGMDAVDLILDFVVCFFDADIIHAMLIRSDMIRLQSD